MVREEVGLQNKLISEFIGTFLLVLTVTCHLLNGGGVFAGLSIAAILMVMIYALGDVSGAHFNPAVTVAISLSNQQKWITSLYYIIVQLLAGVAGGLIGTNIFGHAANLAPKPGFTWPQAAGAEILYTFMLCFVVLNTACCRANAGNQYFGLAIGFVIVAGAYGAGNISGGCFNPAVAFGIDASSAKLGFGWSVAYTGYELIGAAAAALLYKTVRPEEFTAGQKGGIFEKLVSEFLGTYFLVLTVGLNVLTGSAGAAFSIAASLMCMIYALGSVSGGHFNPAVTLSILFAGRSKISSQDALYYIGAQLLGGVLGAMTYRGMVHPSKRSFPLAPSNDWVTIGLAEFIFTFVLCYVVLAVATTRNASKDMFGLAIGSCVTVGGLAIGKVSGGSLNPAVSIGVDMIHALDTPAHKFVESLAYTSFEVLGAGAAALVFTNTHVDEYIKK